MNSIRNRIKNQIKNQIKSYLKISKETISRIYGEILAQYYDGKLKLHYINQKGYWEFSIESYFYGEEPLYKTKGLR